MKKVLVFLFCSLTAVLAQTPKGTPAPPVPLDPVFTAPTLWETPSVPFVESNKGVGLHWVSAAQDSAQSVLKGATFFGQPVCQTLVRCEGGKLKEINVLFYNRGDSGDLNRADYEGLIKKTIAAISAATKTTFVPRGKDSTNAVRVDGVIWTTPQTSYVLEYSCTKTVEIPFRSEFVRLRMLPIEKPKSLLEESFAASKAPPPFRGADHVTRDTASGDVAIKDVPMVDQGEKGYCVVAAAERVLRYYGIKVDANELAQLANSSASEGTSLRAMTETLKKLTGRFKIRVRSVYEIDFTPLIVDYNQAARRAKSDLLNSDVKSARELYVQMKPELLREVRTKNRSAFSGFKRQVKAHVDTGIPIQWSVVLGILPDGSTAKSPSGHMRLIIGYNEKTDEILYSDTWGPGHELKRMPSGDAWTITNSMATVEPL